MPDPALSDLRTAARVAAGHLAPARAAVWRQVIAGLDAEAAADKVARRLTPLVVFDLQRLRHRFERHPERDRAAEAATASPTGAALTEVARLIRAAMEIQTETETKANA